MENEIKKLCDELAEKEHALILAAQFGKSLIDEKEELEKQIECMKREHQIQIEYFEQEAFEMKRSMETMRNEYESKVAELSEDIALLNKQLKHSQSVGWDRADQTERIQELSDSNEAMDKQIAALEYQLTVAGQKGQNLEAELAVLNSQLSDSSNLVDSYQKELAKCSNKQKELEFVLVQSCADRDKQNQILDELGQKFLIMENEKNELENLVYRHETEIYNLRRINKLLSYKVNSLTKLNDKNVDGLMLNYSKNVKFAEDDSALDSISNLDNTSEYDDDFDIDNTYFKSHDIDEIEPVEVMENMRYFNCSRLLCDGVSWKQESTESQDNPK